MLEPLYQVHVETREGQLLAVGPKIGHEAASRFLMIINAAIAQGKEREWSNPHLARAISN